MLDALNVTPFLVLACPSWDIHKSMCYVLYNALSFVCIGGNLST